MPLVSIIVPNFNHARFLKQRLDSIVQQTFQNFEVILLDDASTDDSLQTLEKYKQEYSQVSHLVVNKENSGSPFQQWEKGMNWAKGKYIWIAESDDWAEITFLEKLLPLVQQKGVSLAFCNSHWIDEKGKIGQSLSIHNTSFLKDGKAEIAEHLIYHNSIQNVSSVLFKKSFLDQRGCDYIKHKVAGDWLLYVNLLLKSKVAFLEEKLNYFRWYPDNVSNRTNRGGLWTKEGIKVLSLIGGQIKLERKKIFFSLKNGVSKYFLSRNGQVM